MQEYNVKVDEHGTIRWYQGDKLNRLDGPAVEWANADKEWYQNGKRHRLDGPAVEWYDGDKWWYLNGKLHRTDGPAVEYDGDKLWYLNGVQVTEQDVMKKGMAHESVDSHISL